MKIMLLFALENIPGLTITGGKHADRLVGNAGDDVLIGGLGNDLLVGGAGVDTYQMNSIKEKGDRVNGFESSDLIDLRGIFKSTQYSRSHGD